MPVRQYLRRRPAMPAIKTRHEAAAQEQRVGDSPERGP
ncbi:hypothetical protein SALB1_0512 [Salinisphaera sp. LB1]|nr:hypothetical protein SALB1_0512 [Salinisphaera sp. LB1]